MEIDKVSLGIMSTLLPAGIGLGEIPIPQGLPLWAVALIAAIGPGCIGFLSWGGKSLVLIASAYFKAKAEAKKAKAEAMLKDTDRTNDIQAYKLKLEAQAELAAADKAEQIATKMSNTKE